jgi:hypothetical protein
MSNPSQVIASREANFNQASYPPVHVKFPLTSTEWNDLASLVNLKTFQSLDDRIGCPDCAYMLNLKVEFNYSTIQVE